MPLSERFRTRTLNRLTNLYGDRAEACLKRIEELGAQHRDAVNRPENESWTERDVVLITYADQVRSEAGTPLDALNRFLLNHHLNEAINTVHLLPFFPYTSDDGFSVSDYKQVQPESGNWNNVTQLGQSFGLMFDLVLNHCSQKHRWFEGFLKGEDPYQTYFHDVDPSIDLSGVTRPRSLPLLTPFETNRGTRHVWTTFSDDQVDLNFSEPDVLCEMLDVLLFYAAQGARIIRLDAIAYLWKRIGTSCIHLSETHEVVKLMRDVIDEFAPGTILLTETNVPHRENVSYFGDGDEAQMVYQFSLAPLLLVAFMTEDAKPLNAWLTNLEATGAGMTYFNFTASHDGVGVRPLEGLVSQECLDQLVEGVKARQGTVSMKRNSDGSDSPYELNITYFSALADPENADADLHVRRFLTSQSVMLALRGIPGIYFHSLVGTENDLQGTERTGRARSINRRKFDLEELEGILAEDGASQRNVFEGYQKMLRTRIQQPAFHPDAEQRVTDMKNPALVSFLRTSLDGKQNILVLANVSSEPLSVDLSQFTGIPFSRNLLGEELSNSDSFVLAPFGAAWLS